MEGPQAASIEVAAQVISSRAIRLFIFFSPESALPS